MKFEELDKKILDWLTSTVVTGIIVELNDKLGTIGPEVRAIPQAIRSLVTGGLKPELFTQKLKKDLSFIADKDIISTVIAVKSRILKPIVGPLKTQLAIDIEKIATSVSPATSPAPVAKVMPMAPTPPVVRPAPIAPPKPIVQARETKFEMPQQAMAPKPQTAQAPKPTAGIPQAAPTGPKARTMEFASMTDVKKPESQGTGGQIKQKAPAPATKIEPTASTAPKPFGLSETIPKPPEPHELTKYEDEHPAKEQP